MQPAGDNMFLLWLLLADTGDLASLAFSSWLCVSGDLAPVCRGLKVLDMQIHTRVNTCPQLDIYLLTRVRSSPAAAGSPPRSSGTRSSSPGPTRASCGCTPSTRWTR